MPPKPAGGRANTLMFGGDTGKPPAGLPAQPFKAPAPVATTAANVPLPRPAAGAAFTPPAATPPASPPAATPQASPPATAPAMPAAIVASSKASAHGSPDTTASSAVGGKVNGQLSSKLGDLGLTSQQVEAVLALSREVIERVVWEVVPELAETMIKEEITRLTKA